MIPSHYLQAPLRDRPSVVRDLAVGGSLSWRDLSALAAVLNVAIAEIGPTRDGAIAIRQVGGDAEGLTGYPPERLVGAALVLLRVDRAGLATLRRLAEEVARLGRADAIFGFRTAAGARRRCCLKAAHPCYEAQGPTALFVAACPPEFVNPAS